MSKELSEPDIFGLIYRIDEKAVIQLVGDPHIADGMPVYAAPPPPQWISVEERLPDVAEGNQQQLTVCVRRGHNGKLYVFAAQYLNKYPLYSEYHEDADNDGMLVSTGWYDVKEHCEYDDWYSPLIDPKSGDVITHWQPLPPPPQ